MGDRLLRLGVVSYVNTLPLLCGLEDQPGLSLLRAPPSHLAPLLLDDELDLAILPVAELLANPTLETVSDCCIAATGRVDSVLLLLRRAPHQIRSLILDPHSRSSQLLARLCLRERHGVVPELREADPIRAWRQGEGDAVLIIGDAALELLEEDPPRMDLATEWHLLTGLPFVFAVWAGKPGVVEAHPELPSILEAAREAGLRVTPDIAAQEATRSCLSEEQLQVYLERRIRYRLAAPEREGLARFLAMARTLSPLSR